MHLRALPRHAGRRWLPRADPPRGRKRRRQPTKMFAEERAPKRQERLVIREFPRKMFTLLMNHALIASLAVREGSRCNCAGLENEEP